MGPKIVAGVMTLLLTLGVGVLVFAFMLVVLNGFSERDATWGIAAYGLLALIVALLAAVSSWVIAGRLVRREMHGAMAALLAIVISTFVGSGLVALSGFAGVVIADIVRTNH